MKNLESDQNGGGFALPRVLACMVLFVILPALLVADVIPPTWWSARGVTNGTTPNDYAVVNQGQLKKMATAAYAELQANLPGGAGGTDAPSGTFPGGTGYRLNALIGSWTGTAHAPTNDYAVANIGQVKAVAKLFYDRLIEVGYTDQYPWQSSTDAANDYAVANIGQVKKLFNFDVTTDSDSNGLPDWWEIHYFGSIGQTGTAAAPSGNGLTILQSYQQALDPYDYYKGISPTLTIVSGTNQTGTAGVMLSSPLVVQVTGTSGAPMVNAPVWFAVNVGSGLFAPDNSGTSTLSDAQLIYTGTDGKAQVWFQQPFDASFTSIVGAYAENTEVDFNETTADDSNPPAAPSDVYAESQDDGSVSIAWKDNSDNETGFQILRSDDDGATWIVIATVDPDITSYQIAAEDTHVSQSLARRAATTDAESPTPQYNIAATGAPGSTPVSANPPITVVPPSPPRIPTISFLLVDISGDSTTANVNGIALSDTNTASYCYVSGTDANGDIISSDKWVNGTSSRYQTIKMHAPNTVNLGYRTGTVDEHVYNYSCTESGDMYGQLCEKTEGSCGGYAGQGFFGNDSDYAHYRDFPDPPFHTSMSGTEIADQINNESNSQIMGVSGSCFFGKGYNLICNQSDGTGYYKTAAFITGANGTTIFSSDITSLSSTGVTLKPITFNPIAINDTGMAIDGTNFWDGTSAYAPGSITNAIAINNKNVVLGTVSSGAAAIWQKGSGATGTTVLLSDLVAQMYPNYTSLVTHITPLAISNSGSSDHQAYIVCSGSVMERNGTDDPGVAPVATAETLIFYVNTINPTQSPQLVIAKGQKGIDFNRTLQPMLRSVNRYGILSALGELVATGTGPEMVPGTGNKHAMILIPVVTKVIVAPVSGHPGFDSATGYVNAWEFTAQIYENYFPGLTELKCGFLRDMWYRDSINVTGPNPFYRLILSHEDNVNLWPKGFLPDTPGTTASGTTIPTTIDYAPGSEGNSYKWSYTDDPSLSVTNAQLPYTDYVYDLVYSRYFFYAKFGNAKPSIISEIDVNYFNYFIPKKNEGGLETALQQDGQSSYVFPKIGNALYGQPGDNMPVMHTDPNASEAVEYLKARWLNIRR